MMGPDDEGEEPDDQHGKDERFVTPQRLARIVSQDFGDDSEGRQDQNVNLRMTQEPKQMLPQERAASAADVKGRTIDHHSGGKKKTGFGNSVHQLHHDGGLEWRKREHQKESGHKLRP